MGGRILRLVVFSLLIMVAGVTAVSAGNANYKAHLTGRDEVPARDTHAQGQATFKLSDDGGALHYNLNVANIEHVVAAHIHLGGPTDNGPVVAFLYGLVPVAPGGGRTDGVLAAGTVTAADLRGPLAGQPLSALLAAVTTADLGGVGPTTRNACAPSPSCSGWPV